MRIISHLYSHAEGANLTSICRLPDLNSQNSNDIHSFLDELCKAGTVQEEHHDEIRKGAVIYKITDKGRNFIEHMKKLQSQGFGEGFGFFNAL